MAGLFVSGRIVDLILIFTVIEVVLLGVYRRRTGRGVGFHDLVANLSSGVCLLLALRCAIADAWWGWIGLCLFASLIAHVLDLRRRWK
jgi:hypothetical protein